MNETIIEVAEAGNVLGFCFEDLLRYHGPGYPGGVAHSFKVLERALPLLGEGLPSAGRSRSRHPSPSPGHVTASSW